MKLNYGMVSVAALALGLGACSKTVPIETTIQKIEEPAPIINTIKPQLINKTFLHPVGTVLTRYSR